ncbi:MAG: extracellular catalytic domain type 1 short-chain-length polyhydroxyalkanoate depolymerase [Ramlibacter sp.]
MRPDFQRLMDEATALTRRGDLQGATDLIRDALGTPTAHARPANDDVIDVEAREVPTPADPAAPALPPGEGAAPAPQVGPTVDRAPPPRPAPASDAAEAFLAGRHGGIGAAGREYKLYVPPGAGAQPLPLVVMLHGCTQDADDFAAGTRMNAAAREHGFYVLYPVQSAKANAQRCWNWFKHTHQERDRGEPALLAGMVRTVMAQHAIDPDRIYVAGLSAGGAMAAILGQTHPDLFAAVGVHSGLPAGAARDLPSALEAMKSGASRMPAATLGDPALPVIVFHGAADHTVHPRNGEQLVRPLAAGEAAAHYETVRAPGGRSSTRRIWRDATGAVQAEHWLVDGAPHAWSGGSPAGSYTDPKGPDATAEMLRFFLAHRKAGRA